jgi:hypothetical protein
MSEAKFETGEGYRPLVVLRPLIRRFAPPSPTRGEGKKSASLYQINLDSILLSCPSCQCVAAVALDREGKSPSFLSLSRAP